MKKLFLMLLPLLAIACSGNEGKEQTTGNQELKVMSFNIRYDNPGDSLNNWKFRADRVADAILFYNADVVGTQEVLSNQLADLKERISDRYGMVGVGREDGKEQGEYAALWYKKDRFELCDSGNFWLSQTPEVAGSMGWDGACVRIASWAVLRDKESAKELLALNTHLDHVGQVARREGITLILDRVRELRGDRPVVVTGDFNSTPESDVVAHITGDSIPGHLTNTRTASPPVVELPRIRQASSGRTRADRLYLRRRTADRRQLRRSGRDQRRTLALRPLPRACHHDVGHRSKIIRSAET